MLDIKELLENYGIKNIKIKGDQISCSCPWHTDNHPSFGINAKNRIFNCFSCGSKGTLIDFIARMENIPFEEAKVLSLTKGLEKKDIDLMDRVRKKLFAVEDKEKILDESILEKYKGKIHKSILERVEDKEVLHKFEIGYCSENKRTTFPIRNHMGQLIAVVGRAIGNELPKYKNIIPITGFKKANHLYGLHFCKKESLLILVEGELDVLSFFKSGFPYAVALMGASLGKIQLDLLGRHANQVILALDNDRAGKEATEKIAKQLSRIIDTRIFKYPNEKIKDPGEMNISELYEGLGSSESCTEKMLASAQV